MIPCWGGNKLIIVTRISLIIVTRIALIIATRI